MSDSVVFVPPANAAADSQALPDGVTAPAVREALARVLEADELRPSPQLSNILRFVVEATLDGRQDAIKGYTIAVEALGRDPSFDPQADPIVRVEATRLRRALERYYAGAGAADEIEIMVPRGSYVPQFRLRREEGAGPAEDAQSGLESVPSDTGEAGAARIRPRRLVLGALAAVALAVIAAAGVLGLGHLETEGGDTLAAAPPPVERTNRLGIPMVEVRAFESTGNAAPAGSGQTEFAPRALETRIRDALARFDLVDVLATPDARPAQDCGAPQSAAFSAFALGGLVENHDDGTVSVLLRLSDVCDGTIVWSREFESLKRGGDAIGAEVALVRDIMAAIAEPYGIIQSRARARALAGGGLEAAGPYGCVLLAYSYWRTNQPAEHAAARACLERVLAADDTFALGHALLAELALDEVRAAAPSSAQDEALREARSHAEQAVELAPTSAFARRVLMDVFFFSGERGQAISAGEAALELNPYDVDAVADLGGRLIAFGEIERGEAMLASARGSAPGMPPWVEYHLVIAAYLRGDGPAAAAAADHLMAEGYPPGLLARALASKIAGETDSARADLKKLIALAPAWGSNTAAMVARFFPGEEVARKVSGDLAALGLPPGKAAAASSPSP